MANFIKSSYKEEINKWIRTQPFIRINTFAKKLGCNSHDVISTLKKLSGTQYKENANLSNTIYLKYLQDIVQELGNKGLIDLNLEISVTHSKNNSTSKSKKKKKKRKMTELFDNPRTSNYSRNYATIEKINGGTLGDESGESIKPIYTGMKN